MIEDFVSEGARLKSVLKSSSLKIDNLNLSISSQLSAKKRCYLTTKRTAVTISKRTRNSFRLLTDLSYMIEIQEKNLCGRQHLREAIWFFVPNIRLENSQATSVAVLVESGKIIKTGTRKHCGHF